MKMEEPEADTNKEELVPKTPGAPLAEGLWKMVAGGGLVGVLAAVLIVWNTMQAGADKQAKASVDLELRLRGIEAQLVVLPQISAELRAFSKRPLVTERDFNRWSSEVRHSNPTLTVPVFESEE